MKAKAKINLFLHVTGKNSVNYHLLESLVMFADDVYDLIEIESSYNTQINLSGEFADLLANNNENILHRLLSLLKYSCKINLTKNIPIAAGIGGGSADAACALRMLVSQFSLSAIPKENDQIKELCLKLGADVYSCYHQVPLYFSGIGEVIEPIETIPKLYAVLVNPLISTSTKEIFDHYPKNNYRNKLINKPYCFSSTNELISYISEQSNDLEQVTSKLIPEINIMREALLKQDNCLLARMSGSGATYFGLYETMDDANIAACAIKKQYKNWWVKPTVMS